MSATVAPEKILHDLAALWVEEGKQGSAGVLRACSMTLVVMAEESDDASALGETLAALMPEHPARTILVRLRGGSERTLSERVYQQCWMPFGQRRQICCEQIELVASDAALGDLPSVLLPLVVADLPVILWCRSPRLSAMPEFGDIARLATKVVLDSAAFGEPEAAIARMAEAQARGMRIADLAWTRVTRWREMLARVFENREMLARLSGVAEVKVDCGARHETSAWYLAAWTRNALAAAGLAPAVTVVRNSEAIRVELSGPGLRVALRCDGGTLIVTVNDLTNQTHLEPASDYLLMREELGVARRDTVFERTLSTAARLAVSSKTE
ncbi:MAG: glucose-6-phosphate dehydrogenase assembly protein OpcA [Acidobacteriota bacterium]|nr:glucose-6-phosphate dehydrogenase assembly protein OpcA [Acidobacteriota bacterium]